MGTWRDHAAEDAALRSAWREDALMPEVPPAVTVVSVAMGCGRNMTQIVVRGFGGLKTQIWGTFGCGVLEVWVRPKDRTAGSVDHGLGV